MTTSTVEDGVEENDDDVYEGPGAQGIFTEDQFKSLNERLDRSVLKNRTESGRKLTYIEGYTAINSLNRIFGFGMWDMHVNDIQSVALGEDTMYHALVTVTVTAPNQERTRHQDVGVGLAYGTKPGGHETAIKSAVTDGLKRAARAFGEQFANNLYDKDYEKTRGAEEAAAARTVAVAKTFTKDDYVKAVSKLERERVTDATGRGSLLVKVFGDGAGALTGMPLESWDEASLRKWGAYLRDALSMKAGK